MSEPQSLQQAVMYFSNPDNCVAYLAVRRWPDGKVACPTCGSDGVSAFNPKRKTWKCAKHHPKREFSVKVGTLFEESPIGLDKWLTATWMLTNCKNGISSYEIARDLKVTQKTAWFMLHRIRMALHDEAFGTKLGGPDSEVEADETFIGGVAKNMHKSRKLKLQQIRGEERRGDIKLGKTAVHGMLDREARQIRAQVIPNVRRETLQGAILKNVKYGSKVYTDSAVVYDLLHNRYVHEWVNHMEQYVNGRVHTNGLENFWSLLKRSLRGTYVAVEPFHLDRYLAEQVFRYNNRATKDNPLTDSDRFDAVIRNIVGKRLTFAELTGKPN